MVWSMMLSCLGIVLMVGCIAVPGSASQEPQETSPTARPVADTFWRDALAPLGGVLVGAAITVAATWYFHCRERRTEYAIRNRREIYAPLYEEVIELQGKIREYPFLWRIYTEQVFGVALPSAYGRFQYWGKLESDHRRLRVANDVRNSLDELSSLIAEYNETRPRCNELIGSAIEEALRQESLPTRVSNLGEVCADYVLAGECQAPQAFLDVCFGGDPPAQANEIYARSCAVAGEESTVVRTRELAEKLAASVDDVEAGLRAKIELILSKYEGRLPSV